MTAVAKELDQEIYNVLINAAGYERRDLSDEHRNSVVCNSRHERLSAMTIVKAAAVQISPVLYSREGTVRRVVQKIVELGREGVQFAIFPETIVPYYPYFSYVLRPFELVRSISAARSSP